MLDEQYIRCEQVDSKVTALDCSKEIARLNRRFREANELRAHRLAAEGGSDTVTP